MSGPTRPWGPEPSEPPPEWHEWVFNRENARNKEARWKEYEDGKRGVEHEIIKFHGASHRLDEAMTRKFWDGVADHEIPERLVALWGEYDRYVQHSGPEYEKVRAAALDHFYGTRTPRVDGYWTAEQDLHQRYPNPAHIAPFPPKKIRLSHRLLERAWAWDLNKPDEHYLWNLLKNQFAAFNGGYPKNLYEFKKAVDTMFAALPPEETRGMANPYASVVAAVFEAHALKGRVVGV